MRIGVMLPMSTGDGQGRTPSWASIRGIAQHAEAAGLDSVWVCDHLVSDDPDRPGAGPEGIHEAWTIVAAVAAVTTRVEIGQLVMCVPFRSPALLAKMAITADAVSGGRLILGLGTGWDAPEHRMFGFPIDHRVDRFEEALSIIGPLLRGETVSLAGRFTRVEQAVLRPSPGRRVPILIAAYGPRMLRLTARYADAWNTAWYGAPDEELRRANSELDVALVETGRSPDTLRRTVGIEVVEPGKAGAGMAALDGSLDSLVTALRAYAALGIHDVIAGLRPPTSGAIDRLAEARRLAAV
jgi:alkanesulfonate monooxygenase SsuD/methylene tetrahydromethanopterin reductase-like flavin-dependent oxidoreductase (luciferase family)